MMNILFYEEAFFFSKVEWINKSEICFRKELINQN